MTSNNQSVDRCKPVTLPVALCAAVALLSTSAPASAKSAQAQLAPYSTPAGITLVDVTKIYASSADQFLWRRLGDENGKPLYTFDEEAKSGKPACLDACAKEFTPLLADAKANKQAAPYADWTLVKRPDTKSLQWAYQGKPLYRYAGEDPAGAPFAGDTATAVAENQDWYKPSSKFYSPKAGWARAAFSPEKSVKVPSGIALQSLGIANGFGFIDALSGMTIYEVAASQTLTREWVPVYAPALGLPIGDFSIKARADGTRQWSYRNLNLYTFKGDYAPGDINGLAAVPGTQVALVYRNFMPESVAINILPGRGPLMMTREGKSVYTQARYNLQYGGRETRTGYTIPYNTAKAVGTRGCVEECVQHWIPVKAPADARSAGFWEVATRADGTRQWAYKGSALYTYAEDQKPGDITGNNRHVIVYGDPQGKVSLDVSFGEPIDGGGPSTEAGSGFYWHLASLVY